MIRKPKGTIVESEVHKVKLHCMQYRIEAHTTSRSRKDSKSLDLKTVQCIMFMVLNAISMWITSFSFVWFFIHNGVQWIWMNSFIYIHPCLDNNFTSITNFVMIICNTYMKNTYVLYKFPHNGCSNQPCIFHSLQCWMLVWYPLPPSFLPSFLPPFLMKTHSKNNTSHQLA
jgi:hypothetical protein